VDPQSYTSGERVFGPPRGTFDADWAATALRSTRPDLDHPTSVRLMDRAWTLIREEGLRGDALTAALTDGAGVDPATAADVAAVGTEIAQFYLDR
jgi:citrate synthase